MKLHYGYKITNLTNNRFYYGVRKCKIACDIFGDSYFGSGKILLQAIKKNGLENFRKEFIYVFQNGKEAYDWERELVTQDFIDTNPLCYNIKPGGSGGQGRLSNETKLKMKKPKPAGFGATISKRLLGKSKSEEHKKNMSIARSGAGNPNYGGLSEERCKRMRVPKSETFKKKLSAANMGQNNPMSKTNKERRAKLLLEKR